MRGSKGKLLFNTLICKFSGYSSYFRTIAVLLAAANQAAKDIWLPRGYGASKTPAVRAYVITNALNKPAEHPKAITIA